MSDDVAWLREEIKARLAAAKTAGGLHWEAEGDDPTDDEVYLTCDEPDRFGEMVAFTRGRSSHENMLHIAANDPRDVIARCEAELAILDFYADTSAIVARAEECLRSAMKPPAGSVVNRDYLDGGRELAVLKEIIKYLASGYRHQPGYAEHWAEPAIRQ